MYQAVSWKYAQRVIVKIEINEKGENVRYVVTNFKHNNSRFIYDELTAVHIRSLKTKIKIEFPVNHPHIDLLKKAFLKCACWEAA